MTKINVVVFVCKLSNAAIHPSLCLHVPYQHQFASPHWYCVLEPQVSE